MGKTKRPPHGAACEKRGPERGVLGPRSKLMPGLHGFLF